MAAGCGRLGRVGARATTMPRRVARRRGLPPAADPGRPAQGYRLAGATGLEPATSGVTGRRSNQLSYAPATVDRGATSYLGSGEVSSNSLGNSLALCGRFADLPCFQGILSTPRA